MAAFFDPTEIGSKAANLGVELFDFGGMGGLLGGEGSGELVGEEFGQGGGGLIALGIELIGMDTILGGDLADGAGLAPDFADNLRFERGGIGFAGRCHRILLL